MWTQVVQNGQNRYFYGKLDNVSLRPARELIFSLKNFYLNGLTGKYHSCPGKILYVEKNDLKVTKNRFFGYGILTAFGKSHFSTTNIKNNYNKVYIAKNYVQYRVYWCAHFNFRTFRIDVINYRILDKNYPFFWTFIFAWILWWEVLRKIF